MREFTLPGGIYNATPERIVFGWGSRAQAATEVRRVGGAAVVVTTAGRRRIAEEIVESTGVPVAGVIDYAVPQVPAEITKRAVEFARELDGSSILAIGGGSAVGLGKALALHLDLPVVNVPTTYSGSEMTGFCGMVIDGVKRMHMDRRMLARTVIYDPELAASLPASTSVTSALNALAHSVDALVASSAAPYIKAAAVESAVSLLRALPALAEASDAREVRTEVSDGGYLAGAALTGGYGVQHGLAHALGGTFGIEHSRAHAVLLPHVTRFLIERDPVAFEALAEFGDDAGAERMRKALDAVGVGSTIADLGISTSDHERITDLTMDELGKNPTPANVRRDDVLGILAHAQGKEA
jgi:maleylacetate reductase